MRDIVEEWQRAFDAVQAGQAEQAGVAARSAKVSGIAQRVSQETATPGGGDDAGAGARSTRALRQAGPKARRSTRALRQAGPKARRSSKRKVVYESSDSDDGAQWSGGEEEDDGVGAGDSDEDSAGESSDGSVEPPREVSGKENSAARPGKGAARRAR